MSDNYKWDGDLYQGKPEGEKKYEYYKVGGEQNGTGSGETDRTENTSGASEASCTSEGAAASEASYRSEGTAASEASYTSEGTSSGTAEGAAASAGGEHTAGTAGASGDRAAGTGNPYMGSQTGGTGYPGSGFQPHQQVPPRSRRTRRQKHGDGIGKKFGVTISLALVFGLVAGLVFQGVNVLGNRYLQDNTSTQPQLQSTGLVEQTEAAAGSTADSAGNSVAAVAESAMPSVVAITTISVQEVQSFFGGVQKYQGVSSGSGVIVGENEEELLIATNNHVVEDAEELSVCFIGNDVATLEETQATLEENGGLDMDGAVSASVKGTDPTNDLAVVAVKKADIPAETMAQIKIASIGNSDDLQVGEQVVAIGNALGYGQSVTSGYVSALNRQVTFENSNTATMIQTDTAINPGNSGGALLNMQGQLIGINTAKESSDTVEGMGYAIPVNTASPILDELMTRETREKVDESESAYMGITVQNLSDEMIEMYNMPRGAFVASVTEGSAAEKAGILQNDIITGLDGQTVTSRDDLLDKMQYYKAGETVEIVVDRANAGQYEEQTLTITFDSQPKDAR